MAKPKLSQKELKALIEEEIKMAGNLFREMDKDNSNSLSMKEVEEAVAKRKAAAAAKPADEKESVLIFYEEVQKNFATIDKNKDNKLSFVEFMLAFDKAKDSLLARVA